MEILGFIDVPIWLLGVITFFLSICIYTRYKQTYFTRNGFVQLPTTFFLGDFLQLAKKGMAYVDVDTIKQYGKVFGSYLGNQPNLMICDADLIKHIFVKDFSNFTERGEMFPIPKQFYSVVAQAKGSHWKFLRSTLSPTFSSGKLRQMKPYIKRCLDQFHEIIDEKISEGQDFDIVPILRGYTMDVICSTGFGLDVNSQRDPDNPFLKYARTILDFSPAKSLSFISNVFFPDFSLLHWIIGPADFIPKQSLEFFNSATSSAFEERKKSDSKHKDLLQLMINAHKDINDGEHDLDPSLGDSLTMEDFKKRGLTDDEVLMNSLVFMVAGFDTTATTISWVVYDLMLYPEVQRKLVDEIDKEIGQNEPTYDNVFKMSYLDMVVNETLRMHPPATRLNRMATEDTEICGVKIPKDVFLVFIPLVLHFMEEYWEKPYEYIPERFASENKDKFNEYAFIPFGTGPRNCIGMRLALLEVKMTIVSLLQKYRINWSDKLKVPMPVAKVGLHQPSDPVYVNLVKREM